MTTNIPLARRAIACGLPVPVHANRLSCLILSTLQDGDSLTKEHVGLDGYDPRTRIMWQCVATDTGPELLPVLDDPMLLGWLITELECAIGHATGIDGLTGAWAVWGEWDEDALSEGPTRIEALIAALEAAKAAG